MMDELYTERRRANAAWKSLEAWLDDGGDNDPWAALEGGQQIIPCCLLQLVQEIRALRETIEHHGI